MRVPSGSALPIREQLEEADPSAVPASGGRARPGVGVAGSAAAACATDTAEEDLET